MQNKNLSLLFNKLYYKNYENVDDLSYNKEHELWNSKLRMKITYPGLITGIGLNHEIGIKNGILLDYTSGLPYISASTVKGTIKSFLNNIERNNFNEFKKYFDLDFNFEIFEEFRKFFIVGDSKKGFTVFFDAEIVSSDEKRILSDDYITPHENPLKNPNPIKFLKIRPGVILEFRFRLNDIVIGNIVINEIMQLELIQKILFLYGIGAKTNVGYGYFDEKYGKKQLEIDKKECREIEEKKREKKIMKDKSENFISVDIAKKINIIFKTDDKLLGNFKNYFSGNLVINNLDNEIIEYYNFLEDEEKSNFDSFLDYNKLEKGEKKIILNLIEERLRSFDGWDKFIEKDRKELEKKKKKDKSIVRYLFFVDFKSKEGMDE